jgi:hypothetical protein
MNAANILTLRSFLLALHQLPAIPPELQAALQNLPADPAEMMPEVYKLIKQEPLATQYQDCRDELQAREGQRKAGDRPIVSSNIESTNEHSNESVDPIDLFESQTEDSLTTMMQEIINSPCQDIKSTIDPFLNININV